MKHFFEVGILPELVGNFYSRPTDKHPTHPSEATGKDIVATYKFCYCHEDKNEDMIGCDNPDSSYEWFHFSCLKLSSEPKSTLWYCPDCSKLPQLFRRKKSKIAK